MIYAIRFGMFGYLKFGVSANPVARLAALQSAAPVELDLVALADWPDEFEGKIHDFLRETRMRGEWFAGRTERSELVLECMDDSKDGMCRFLDIYRPHFDQQLKQHAATYKWTKGQRRRFQRLAWWMGREVDLTSRARFDFKLDPATRKWVKSDAHKADGRPDELLDVGHTSISPGSNDVSH